MYSAALRNWFTECASTMSPARMARLVATNSSRSSSSSKTQATHRECSTLARTMHPPQLDCIVLQLDRLLQQSVVAVPLHKVGAAHEGTMLARAAIVVPEVEVREIDWIGERRSRNDSVLVKPVDNGFGLEHFRVRAGDNFFGLRIDPIDEGLGVALGTNLFHISLGTQVVRPFLADRVGQVPAETI